MVKGEALLFLAGHFFFSCSFFQNLLLQKNIERSFPIAITGVSNVLIKASCFYRGLFLFPLSP